MGWETHYAKYSTNVSKERITDDMSDYADRHHDQMEGTGKGSGGVSRLEFLDVTFDDEETAIQYLESKREHWNGACKLKRVTEAKDTRLTVKLRKDLQKLSTKINSLKEKYYAYLLANSLPNKKTKITCPKCESRLNAKYLTWMLSLRNCSHYFIKENEQRCPLCRTDLNTETVKERIAKYCEDIRSLQATYKTTQANMEKSKKVVSSDLLWLVKIEYHI